MWFFVGFLEKCEKKNVLFNDTKQATFLALLVQVQYFSHQLEICTDFMLFGIVGLTLLMTPLFDCFDTYYIQSYILSKELKVICILLECRYVFNCGLPL